MTINRFEEVIKVPGFHSVTDNGNNFYIFIPEKVHSNTGIVIDGYGYNAEEAQKRTVNNNNIVIFPRNSDTFYKYQEINHPNWNQRIEGRIVDYIKKYYNINDNCYGPKGWSAAANGAINSGAAYIRANPGARINVAVVSPATEYNNAYHPEAGSITVRPEDWKAYADSGSTIVYLESFSDLQDGYKKGVQLGANIVRIKANYISGGGHETEDYLARELDLSSISNGTFDFTKSITEKLDPRIVLDENNPFSFIQYTYENGQIKERYISAEEANRILSTGGRKTLKFNGIGSFDDSKIESSVPFLSDKLNDLRQTIISTTVASSSLSDPRYASTTQIPKSEANIINYFINAASLAFQKLNEEITFIGEIGDSINQMNINLSKQAESLGISLDKKFYKIESLKKTDFTHKAVYSPDTREYDKVAEEYIYKYGTDEDKEALRRKEELENQKKQTTNYSGSAGYGYPGPSVVEKTVSKEKQKEEAKEEIKTQEEIKKEEFFSSEVDSSVTYEQPRKELTKQIIESKEIEEHVIETKEPKFDFDELNNEKEPFLIEPDKVEPYSEIVEKPPVIEIPDVPEVEEKSNVGKVIGTVAGVAAAAGAGIGAYSYLKKQKNEDDSDYLEEDYIDDENYEYDYEESSSELEEGE